MNNIIKKINMLGYKVLIVDNTIIVSSLAVDTEIHLRVVEKEICIINFNMRYVTKFDIRLLFLLNSLLIKFCEQKHLVFSEVFYEKN